MFFSETLKDVCKMAIITLVAFGCANEGNDDDDDTRSFVTKSIVGEWLFERTDVCTEVTTYGADNSIMIESNEEVQEGTYTFEETIDEGNRHKLEITITSDNQLPDCLGDTEASLGSAVFYLEFNDNNSQHNIYRDASGGDIAVGPFNIQ